MAIIAEKNRLLTSTNQEYIELAQAMAEAEKAYNMRYARDLLQLKEEGTPMAIIKEVCKGSPKVAQANLELNLAEMKMKACLEALKNIRIAIDSARSVLTWIREEKTRA